MLYSHSRLKTYENCPLQFRFKYIDKVDSPYEDTTIEAFLGKLVHNTLEKLYNDLKEGEMNSLDELLDHFHDAWEQGYNPDIRIVKDGKTADEYRRKGEEFIRRYYKNNHPFDDTETVGVEDRVIVELDEGYRLQGYIDRLSYDPETETFRVHDYKTGWMPSVSKLKKDRQLALYSIAVREKYDTDRVRLVWHFLAWDEDVEIEKTDAELEELKRDTAELIEEIENADEFPAKPSRLCSYCDFQPLCPEWEDVSVDDVTKDELDDEIGAKLVDRYADIQEEIRDRKRELRAIERDLVELAEDNDASAIVGSEHKARLVDENRIHVPETKREEIETLLKEHSVWEDVSKIDNERLTKIIDAYPLNPDDSSDPTWEPWPTELLAELSELISKANGSDVYVTQKNGRQ